MFDSGDSAFWIGLDDRGATGTRLTASTGEEIGYSTKFITSKPVDVKLCGFIDKDMAG